MSQPYIRSRPYVWLALIFLTYIQSLVFFDHGLSVDAQISNLFFDFTCQAKDARACWLLDKSDRHLSYLLHDLPVDGVTAIGVFVFCVLVAGFKYEKLKSYREVAFLALLGIAIVPAIVAVLKAYTGHYCPGQLAVYKGVVGMPDIPQPRPRCFPAAFPATGFGLLVLCFGSFSRTWRYLALCAGLGLGGVMSAIQIARGEHFLSHCLATMMTALFIGMLVLVVRKNWQDGYRALMADPSASARTQNQ